MRQTDAIARASEIYRGILRARYRAYREHGLAGVTPYVRRTKVTSPAAPFITALESFELLEEFYPDFDSAFQEFPAFSPDYLSHRFYVRKEQVPIPIIWRRPLSGACRIVRAR